MIQDRAEAANQATRELKHAKERFSLLRTYARALAMLGQERKLTRLLAAANLGVALVMLLEPLFFGRMIDALSANRSADAWRNIAAWAAFGCLGVVAAVLLSLHSDRLAHRCRKEAISRYVEHVISLPLSFHDRNHSGRLLHTMHSGSGLLFSVWLNFFRTHLSTMFSLLVMIPVAIYLNWKLAIGMTAMMSVYLAFNIFIVRRTTRAQVKVEELNKRVGERVGDLFANVSVVQSFLRLSAEMHAVRDMLSQMLAVQYPILKGFAVVSVAQRTASTLTVILIFALGVYLNGRGEVSVGGIVSFVAFAMFMLGRLEQLAHFVSDLSNQARPIDRFFDVLDTRDNLSDAPDATDMLDVQGEVEFENVSFRYESQDGQGPRDALRTLSFKVRPGQTAALVGSTGAGKTTALALLYRAYDPTAGRILVDGMDIRRVSRASLRRQLAVVFQEPGLLFRSIADNLRIGDPEATDEEMHAVAEAAQAHRFVMAKPEGYATTVTERGRSLSGGERQRLAIARALLKDAPILILDEATSALDVATEMDVQLALRALAKRRTTLVIAHRLSTIRHADIILVLKEGTLVEQGTYNELMLREGVFAALARAGEFAVDVESSTSAQFKEITATGAVEAAG